jgi:hypothetical protein
MKKITTLRIKKYKKSNPTKAKMISSAIKRGMKQYAETFRRLASA